METDYKLSRREKVRLVTRYLRGCWGYFAAALLCACLSMAFNALTPQIIRLTVDSVLDTKEPGAPAWLLRLLHWDALTENTLRALWIAAAAVLLVAILRGLCSYGQRINLSKGSETYVKGLRRHRHVL